jgi:hypothetical protein
VPCEGFEAPTADSTFSLTFFTQYTVCQRPQKDSSTILIKVKNPTQENIEVNNVITLNQDGRNDYFVVLAASKNSDCLTGFEGVEVFSRWGRKVFSSSDVNFSWRPEDNRPTLYFYRLRFRGKAYKGWLEAVGE